jgi:hypothetical protein
VHGDRLLVGAPHHGLGVPGRAYLYRRDAASAIGWTLERDFTSADPASAFEFGQDVALGDATLVVCGSTTSRLPYSDSYVVHVRELDAGGSGSWGEVARFASQTGAPDFFGWEVALDGERLAVVAPGEWDFRTNALGALYLYERAPAGGWQLVRRLASSDELFLADEVDLRGDWLVAGAPGQTSGGQLSAGAVVVFGRNVGGADAWGEVARVTDGDPEPSAMFGLDLALEQDELLVGAPGAYAGALGGEVYALDLARLARASWRNDALGTNPDVHRAVTRPILGTSYVAEVDLAASGHARALLIAFAHRAERTLPGGQVLLGAGRLGHLAGSGALAHFDVPLPADPALCGLALTTQAVLLGGAPLALSNAQDLVLGAR